MKHLLLFINALAVTTAFLCFPAKAENITFDLKNGIQEIDFDNDEVTELLVRSRRDIGNAHSYDIITVFKKHNGMIYLIPFSDHDGEMKDSLQTVEKAECVIQEISVSQKTESAELIKTVRDQHNNMAYTIRYTLTENQDSIPGVPKWMFIPSQKVEVPLEECL